MSLYIVDETAIPSDWIKIRKDRKHLFHSKQPGEVIWRIVWVQVSTWSM